jgi:uncharacterized membrane protein HdeD (DUF308 family)
MNPNQIDHVNHAAQWSVVASVALILAGLLAIIAPAVSGLLLTMVVAWVLIFGGVAHFVYAFNTHTGSYPGMGGVMHSSGSMWWEILLGILYVATGIYMLINPVVALATLTVVLASYLAVAAILEFVLAFHFRHVKGSGWLLFDAIISLVLAVLIFRTWPQNSLWVIGTLVGISILFSGTTRLSLAMTYHRMTKAAHA